jgi:hypothetical protein
MAKAQSYISKLLKEGDKDLTECFKCHGSFYEVIPGKESDARSTVAAKLMIFGRENKKKLKKSIVSDTNEPIRPVHAISAHVNGGSLISLK